MSDEKFSSIAERERKIDECRKNGHGEMMMVLYYDVGKGEAQVICNHCNMFHYRKMSYEEFVGIREPKKEGTLI